MKKINTKKLKQFYQTETSGEMRDFVSNCVADYMGAFETSGTPVINTLKFQFLLDLGLLIDIPA